jgi:hypothetical protein
MIIKTQNWLFQSYCILSGQFGVMLSFSPPKTEDEAIALLRSAPCLRNIVGESLGHPGGQVYIFSSEGETREVYLSIAGNPLVYACLCNSDGDILMENT